MNTRSTQLHKRQTRIRARLKGTSVRPRLSLARSNTRLSVELVDDSSGKTLTTLIGAGKNTQAAIALGNQFASWAKEHKVTQIVFDRSGHLYHGSIKALADAIREGGVKV